MVLSVDTCRRLQRCGGRHISPLDNGPSKKEMEEYIANLVSWGWHEGMKAEAERLAKRIEESNKPAEDPRIEVVRDWLATSVSWGSGFVAGPIKDLLSRLDSVKEK